MLDVIREAGSVLLALFETVGGVPEACRAKVAEWFCKAR